MKVMVVHNRYVSRNPSGENEVVEYEISALRDAGVAVVPYVRDSDEIPALSWLERATLPVRPSFSPLDAHAIAGLLEREAPDLVHLHNPYPLISPGVVRVAHRRGVPVVQTVHNHRHVCASATFFRDGHECHDCLGRTVPLPAIQHACYRGSHLQSAAMAAALMAHRRSFRAIDRYFVLAGHLIPTLLSIGVSEQRIVVKPNTVADPGPPPDRDRSGALFVGRLSVDKGADLLVRAWSSAFPHPTGRSLRILGDGPLRSSLEALVAHRPDIEMIGRRSPPEVRQHMQRAELVVVPSLAAESFGLVALEALSNGSAVVATGLGGLSEIVTDDVGWTCEPTEEGLSACLVSAFAGDLQKMGEAARRRYVEVYHPARVLEQQLRVYQDVIDSSGKSGSR